MIGNIRTHNQALPVKNAALVTFTASSETGSAIRCATATGTVVEPLEGDTHSINHSFTFRIELPFKPADHAIMLAPRGFEIRGIPLWGYRKVGWSIVDYIALPDDQGLTVDVTVWVNHRRAVSLGLSYHCSATAPVEESSGT